MWRRTGLAVMVGLIVGGLVGVVSVAFSSDHVVYIYNDRFEPQVIDISAGETVVFVNVASRPVWPASDEHPSHSQYPDFDPKAEIGLGESWQFTFTESGIWDFHDHVRSSIRGQIIVRDSTGSAAAGCFVARSGTERAGCWKADFTKLITEEGMDVAFDEFTHQYDTDPVFASICHDILHYFGRAAYEHYQTDAETTVRPETTACGYGYYHGFIELSLEQSGGTGLEIAKAYCEDLNHNLGFATKIIARNAANACKHGIGHAVFDTIDGSLWGDMQAMTDHGIDMCRSVYTNEYDSFERCATGIYNSLANALSSESYNLAFPDSIDPLMDLCATQDEAIEGYCLLDVVVGYTKNKDYSPTDQLTEIL
ncbi:MAG: hypothetical protein AAFO91_03705, partial [Bacteroidota bacterium]